MATVTIDSVSQYFGKNHVLNDINLQIEKGEFLVIVGPSGCGKSTLLRLIAGLDRVDAGSIMINEQCVNTTPPSSRDIAMVFQNYALYPHMTVYDNMAYGLKMRKIKKSDIRERVEAAGKMLQLMDCMQRKPNALSGGQRQRVAMGRAIVRNPSVFLFDEPLSNLDFKLRTEMRYEIKKLHQQLNATCIYVTHDQTEAMTMASRVVILHQGQIQQVGSPRMVYDYPDSMFVASFLGHYPINFISAMLDFTHQRLQLGTGTTLPMPSLVSNSTLTNEVIVGIRPEHVKFVRHSEPDSFSVIIESIDDMGSEKLVHALAEKNGKPIIIRIPGDVSVQQGKCFVKMDLERATVFCKDKGKRLGGWHVQG